MAKDIAAPDWVKNLRRLMEEQKFNARSLSLRAGLNATAVRDMIEGRSRYPRYDTVESLAGALQTTPALLMRGEEESTSSQTEPLGNDIDLLAEIITRLKETAAEIGRDLAPREFAAMSATLYKRIQEDRDLKTRSVRISAIKPQIYDLLEYEALRHKRSKQ